MSITERMFKIMESKGIKPAEFARKINTTPQGLKNWKDRGTTPPMEYLPTICEALGVSWEYLVLGEEKEEQKSSEDSIAMELFRTLPYEAKNDAIRFLSFQHYKLAENQSNTREDNK